MPMKPGANHVFRDMPFRRHRLRVRGVGHPLVEIGLVWLPRVLALAALMAAVFVAAGYLARLLSLAMNWG